MFKVGDIVCYGRYESFQYEIVSFSSPSVPLLKLIKVIGDYKITLGNIHEVENYNLYLLKLVKPKALRHHPLTNIFRN